MTPAENRAARKDELTKVESRIRKYWLRLFHIAAKDGRAYVMPSIDTTGAACGCSRSSVKRARAKFRRLGLFAFGERFRIHGALAWRLPDVIYMTARDAFVRPVPRLTHAPAPTRRQRFTETVSARLHAEIAGFWLRKTPLPSPAQGRLIFDAASSIPSLKEEN